MTAIATAWALTHHQISTVIAGTNTVGQFEDYLKGAELVLEQEDIELLNTVSYGAMEEFIITNIEKKAKQLGIKW